MGNINCSCFNNNEKDQIIFEKSDIIGQNIVFEQNKIFELISKYYDEKNKTRKFKIKSAPITFGENSITKILNIHKQKIKNWYYNYR